MPPFSRACVAVCVRIRAFPTVRAGNDAHPGAAGPQSMRTRGSRVLRSFITIYLRKSLAHFGWLRRKRISLLKTPVYGQIECRKAAERCEWRQRPFELSWAEPPPARQIHANGPAQAHVVRRQAIEPSQAAEENVLHRPGAEVAARHPTNLRSAVQE